MTSAEKNNRLLRWFPLQVRARRLFNQLPLSESQNVYFLTLIIRVLSGVAVVLFNLLLEFFQPLNSMLPLQWRAVARNPRGKDQCHLPSLKGSNPSASRVNSTGCRVA